ncbi:unnamed protein product [Closterium sp. NIES-54]
MQLMIFLVPCVGFVVEDVEDCTRLVGSNTVAATASSAAPADFTAMASLRVLAFDHEGRPVQFDTWLDDLQLNLLSDIKDSVSLFDHVTAQALYDVVVARYSSPATAALGRLLLPYLFPDVSSFATVKDLVSHLRASDAHYRAAVPAEFLDKNQPPMFIPLYFIVTRLPDSLRSVTSCRLLSHQTLLWHHHMGHPSLPRLRGMHSRLLLSGLPRSLPPLPPSPAPPCLPCIEGRQHAAPHSSSFPATTALLQTLHMDVWGPARVNVRLQLRERFGQDLPVLRLHSDRGGEFSSNLSRDFCRGEGILQTFTLPDSPQQNGIAELRISLVMEVARTSMIHAAAPHFMWPFAVRYAVHQLNLCPRVSLPETSPTLRWTGEVGDALVSRVWGSRAFVRDTSEDKLSPCAIPCVFLGFVLDAPGWQFYHPTSRCVFPSQDITFDESVPFYHLFPYRSAPPPPPSLFLAPGPPPVDPLLPQGPAPASVSQVDPLSGPAPVQVAVGSGAASGGAVSGGAEPGGVESEGAETVGAEPGGVATRGGEPGGAEPEGVEPGGVALEGAESGGAEP